MTHIFVRIPQRNEISKNDLLRFFQFLLRCQNELEYSMLTQTLRAQCFGNSNGPTGLIGQIKIGTMCGIFFSFVAL